MCYLIKFQLSLLFFLCLCCTSLYASYPINANVYFCVYNQSEREAKADYKLIIDGIYRVDMTYQRETVLEIESHSTEKFVCTKSPVARMNSYGIGGEDSAYLNLSVENDIEIGGIEVLGFYDVEPGTLDSRTVIYRTRNMLFCSTANLCAADSDKNYHFPASDQYFIIYKRE